MKILLWSLLALFLIGNAVFVLPVHLSSDNVVTNYYINYKRDSLLLKNVFTDSAVQLKLNMPAGYQALYASEEGPRRESANQLFVNVSVFHNLDFTALAFPFFKRTSFNGVIPFYSVIKASNAPDRDSTALVGNIVINGSVAVTGISSPLYARTLVEKKLVSILNKEMIKITADINRPTDTTQNTVPVPVLLAPVRHTKARKR